MRTSKEGFIGPQVLLMTASIAIASLLAVPKYQAVSDRTMVTEALTLAGDLQGKLAHRFMVTGKFPTSNKHASAMISSRFPKPEFIRDMRIQPDQTGETVTIKVFLKHGLVENPTGEIQHIYIAGNKNSGDGNPIQWQCGAAGLGPELLPDDCRGTTPTAMEKRE